MNHHADFVSVARIQSHVRRFTQRVKYKTLLSLARKRRSLLTALRQMYEASGWAAPCHVPREWHQSMLERLIERDVFDTRDGAPALDEVRCPTNDALRMPTNDVRHSDNPNSPVYATGRYRAPRKPPRSSIPYDPRGASKLYNGYTEADPPPRKCLGRGACGPYRSGRSASEQTCSSSGQR